MADYPQTLIVVPCYNESKRLPRSTFVNESKKRSWLQFLFVDDGSTDETLTVLEEMASENPEQISVLHLTQNSGKAEAVRQGILKAAKSDAQILGYWDADLATPIEEVDDMCRSMSSHDPFIMLGVRLPLLGHRINRKSTRKALAKVFALTARFVLGISVHDTQCGAKLLKNNELTEKIFEKPFLTRWIFDVEILSRILASEGMDESKFDGLIFEHPLSTWKDVPGSKLRAKDFVIAARDMLLIATSSSGRFFQTQKS